MDFERRMKEVQDSLREQGIDGWLLYDYHRSNEIAHAFLQIPKEKMVSRRFFYWIPQTGDPIKIVPLIEPHTLDHLPGLKWLYRGWQDLERLLASLAVENSQIAMEYSPYNALPSISKVDAGIVELLRKRGAEIVSSAHMLQRFTSIWTPQQIVTHLTAASVLEKIADRTWGYIKESLRQKKRITECHVQQFMCDEMEKEGCCTDDRPICAVNAHSANPHYNPSLEQALPVCEGDFVLIDLWCKQKVPHAVYADITRVGVVANSPNSRQIEIFNIVKMARDKATQFIKENYESNRPLQGWQADQTCRDVIQQAGYGEYFIHRTGHNIGEDVHGPGANLDNLETHDVRTLIPGTGFSVEPGIYLPQEFGVRLEYNVFLEPHGVARITGGIQNEIVKVQL